MIERAWLTSQEQLVVEYQDDTFLSCRLNERAIELWTSEFVDGTNATNMLFFENDIILFRVERDGLQMDFAKQLITEWLIKRNSHNKWIRRYKDIVPADIYDAYTRGEDAMIEFHWQQVAARLREMVRDISIDKLKLLEALELCLKSPFLKRFVPYISVGRLCLSNTTVAQPYSSDCFCLNYLDGKFEVADYEHKGIQLFDEVNEAVRFLENFYKPSDKNRFA